MKNVDRLFSNDKNDRFVKTAYNKYITALESDITERIFNAIIGLDTIFLNKNEYSDILSKRIGRFMEKLEQDSTNIVKKVKQAYKIRNQISHDGAYYWTNEYTSLLDNIEEIKERKITNEEIE